MQVFWTSLNFIVVGWTIIPELSQAIVFTISTIPGFIIWYYYIIRIYNRFKFKYSNELDFHSSSTNPLYNVDTNTTGMDPLTRIDLSRPSIGTNPQIVSRVNPHVISSGTSHINLNNNFINSNLVRSVSETPVASGKGDANKIILPGRRSQSVNMDSRALNNGQSGIRDQTHGTERNKNVSVLKFLSKMLLKEDEIT